MDNDYNFSLKREVKNEYEEESCFDSEFSCNFDCFKKEEEEISDILNDDNTFLNIPQDHKAKVEDLPSDQYKKIRQSEFPIILLKKLDIDFNDKIRIICVKDDVIQIYRYKSNEVQFEEDLINEDHQNYCEGFTTKGKKASLERRTENANLSVGSPTEPLADKKPQKVKFKGKQLMDSKRVDIKSICKIFKCHECNYKTNLNCNLKRHVRTHNTSLPIYRCSECDHSTNRKDNLKNHILNHFDCKFKCCFCDFKTSEKRNFNRHMLIHSKEKLLKCRICDYKTNYSHNLKTHEFNHSGRKQFECSECSYKTNFKKNLVRHILNHSGTKSLECHACDYKTNDVSHLKRHKKAFSH